MQVWDKSLSNIKMKTAFCMWHIAVKLHLVDVQQMVTSHLHLLDWDICSCDIYGYLYMVY